MALQCLNLPWSDLDGREKGSDDIPSSVWICLSCGSLLCGRASKAQHALSHSEQSEHHVALAMPSLDSVWCYACDQPIDGSFLETQATYKVHSVINVHTLAALDRFRTILRSIVVDVSLFPVQLDKFRVSNGLRLTSVPDNGRDWACPSSTEGEGIGSSSIWGGKHQKWRSIAWTIYE